MSLLPGDIVNVVDQLLQYTAVGSQSDVHSPTLPSCSNRCLCGLWALQLREMGVLIQLWAWKSAGGVRGMAASPLLISLSRCLDHSPVAEIAVPSCILALARHETRRLRIRTTLTCDAEQQTSFLSDCYRSSDVLDRMETSTETAEPRTTLLEPDRNAPRRQNFLCNTSQERFRMRSARHPGLILRSHLILVRTKLAELRLIDPGYVSSHLLTPPSHTTDRSWTKSWGPLAQHYEQRSTGKEGSVPLILIPCSISIVCFRIIREQKSRLYLPSRPHDCLEEAKQSFNMRWSRTAW
jgi:hypothetical protein